MEIWGTLAAFAALLAFTGILQETYTLKSAAPLAAVSLSTLYFSVAGCFGLLRAAGWFYFAAAAAAAVWLCAAVRKKAHGPSFPGWGFWLFAGGGLCIIGPVSYTHLDVYKRQAGDHCASV